MSRFSSRNSAGTGCKVYIGGLTQNASKDEIEEAFERYGRLRSVFVARNPPGFAFVEFGDPYDAEDSVKALDGRLICGSRVKVEISHGRSRPKNFGEIDSYRRDRDPRDRRMDDRDYRRDYQRPGRSDSHRRSRSFSPSRDRKRVSHSRSRSPSPRGQNGRSSEKLSRHRSEHVSRSRSRG